MANTVRRAKDIVLTTLIDLLVQLIFIFILILIVREVSSEQPSGGYDLSRPWQTLVNALGSEKKPGDVQQAQQIADEGARYIQQIKQRNRELEADKSKACGGKGPGKPLCVNQAGQDEPFFAEILVQPDGLLFATMLVLPQSLSLFPKDQASLFGVPLSQREFLARFRSVKEYSQDCNLRAHVAFTDEVSGRTLDQARKTVDRYFYTDTYLQRPNR